MTDRHLFLRDYLLDLAQIRDILQPFPEMSGTLILLPAKGHGLPRILLAHLIVLETATLFFLVTISWQI